MHIRIALLVLLALLAIACGGPQSALAVAGRDAERIRHLFIVMSIGAFIVWAAVVTIAIYAIRKTDSHSTRAGNLLVIGGGFALPTVVLAGLLAYGLPMIPAVLASPSPGALRIHVTGKQWWWRVEYVTAQGRIETANEIRVPLGQRVEFQLTSPDVIHSFWVPSIAGKMDMIPGRVTRLALEPTRTGVFRGACAEYCGASHARMAFEVVVLEAQEFSRWLDAQSRAAPSPSDPQLVRGATAFVTHGCTACHTVRGIAEASRIGPDLTHVGSRLRLAAGTLPNGPGAFAGWILDPERVKPGVHMPAFRTLSADDVTALAAYLESLQ
jgi:cytochrome c oxidase subunit 2